MGTLTEEETELIDTLYHRYSAKLTNVAAAVFHNNRSMAEDAVGQTFLLVCQHPEKIVGHPCPEAALTTNLHNITLHMKRDIARYQALFIGILPLIQNDTVEHRLELDALYPGLWELPEFQIVKRFSVDGLSIADLAEELGISIDACKKRLQRARKVLADRLGK